MRLTAVAYYKEIAVLTLAKKLFLFSLIIIISSVVYGSDMDYEPTQVDSEKAYLIGKLLRSQFKNAEARRFLKYSADNGNMKAAYLYAVEIMANPISERAIQEGRSYLVRAAIGGNRHAMRHLSEDDSWLSVTERNTWKQSYYDSLIELGKFSPEVAFYELSNFYADNDFKLSQYYLAKSIEFSYPPALMKQADNYMLGQGSFYFPGKRDTEARKLYLSAAQLDYLPAIKTYIQLLENKGNLVSALELRKKSLELGDITSLVSVAFIYSGSFSQNYQFVEHDYVKAKAYLNLFIDNVGQDKFFSLTELAKTRYSRILDNLSEEQLASSLLIENHFNNRVNFYNYDLYWDI